mgnify:CR=1 FL=1
MYTFSCLSQELVQNKNQSKITFKIKNFGFNVIGVFKDFNIKSQFNSNNLKESFFNVEIDVKSIDTNSKSRDNHLLKSDFFDVDKHPKIIFKSSAINKINKNQFTLIGFLNIKGTKKKFEVPIEIKTTVKQVVFKVNFNLNRKDFNVGGSSFVLSKKVEILLIFVADKS